MYGVPKNPSVEHHPRHVLRAERLRAAKHYHLPPEAGLLRYYQEHFLHRCAQEPRAYHAPDVRGVCVNAVFPVPQEFPHPELLPSSVEPTLRVPQLRELEVHDRQQPDPALVPDKAGDDGQRRFRDGGHRLPWNHDLHDFHLGNHGRRWKVGVQIALFLLWGDQGLYLQPLLLRDQYACNTLARHHSHAKNHCAPRQSQQTQPEYSAQY